MKAMARLGHVVSRYRRSLVLAAVGAAGLAGGWFAWSRYVAPTRIAFVNYQEFQLARIVRAKPSPFVQVDVLRMDELDRARDYPAVFVFGRGMSLTDAQKTALTNAGFAGTRVFVEGATDPNSDVTNLRGRDLDYITDYFKHGGAKNYASLLTYVRNGIEGKRVFVDGVEAPQAIGQDVLFHLDDTQVFATVETFREHVAAKGHHKDGQPRIALMTSVPGPFNSNRDHVDAIISTLERRGYNVFPVAAAEKRLEFLRAIDPELVVMMPHGRLSFDGDKAVAWLRERNIPMLSPLSVFKEHDKWVGDQQGMDGALLTMSVTLPELDGGIAPYAVAAQYRDDEGYLVFKAIPERLERFADMVDRWLALRKKTNKDKKVAIYYFKGPGNNALTASNLEVLPSLHRLLTSLRDQGYTVTGLPDDEASFAREVMRRGPVLGPYAKGAFDTLLAEGDPALVDRENYTAWASAQIQHELYDEVEKAYGPPPGDYMAVSREGKDYLAVARLEFGNVAILPQPLPGIGDNTFALVHGTKKAPPHTYLASYLWARNAFKADAIVHLGTHGSLEFTPWKQVALSGMDWPDALIGSTPHFYIYIISNVGEGIIAKRRSYTTTVTHLTPPFKESGVYSDLAKLRDAVLAFGAAPDGPVKAEHGKTIARMAAGLGMDKDLGLASDWTRWTSDEILRLSDHVENLAHEKIPSGLYTWGRGYTDAMIASTVRLMALDPVAYSLARLDVERGAVSQGQVDNAVFFDQRYRQRAQRLIERMQRGEAPEAVAGDLVAADKVAAARTWRERARQPSDTDIIRNFVAMAGAPAAGADAGIKKSPAESLARVQDLVVRILPHPEKREFIDRLQSEKEFERASGLLDPTTRERAKGIARAIPAMAAALKVAEDPDVNALLVAMQDESARTRTFDLMKDPALLERVEQEKARLTQTRVDEALAPGRVAALQKATNDGDALGGGREATPAGAARSTLASTPSEALSAMAGDLRLYRDHRADAEAVAARGTADAAAVSTILRDDAAMGKVARAIETIELTLAARERRQADVNRAILTVVDTLAAVDGHEDALRQSPKEEIAGLVNALNGGYIAPQPGGDPIVNPSAVPTGRNLYSIDAEKTPSAEAWTVGVKLANALLDRHRAAHDGEYPRKVAFTLWPSDFISTEGATVAQILYLLGMEPVRDPFGRVVNIRPIPVAALGRPRIDVVVQTAGQFRDLAASRLYLINRAVRMAAALDDGEAENYVRSGAAKSEEVMKQKGLSPVEARDLSTMRVFGGVNGNYGTGIMELVESGDRWENEEEVATRYLANMGAMYDDGERWSTFTAGVFEAALQDTDAVVQPRESYTWGALSLDHVYEFMGGLSMAARHVTGKDPDAYFNDFRNAQNPRMTELKETVWTEARTTLLNPEYINDLTAGGASSAEKFAETFRNTYGWNVMKPSAIDGQLWDRLYETYVDDVNKLGVQEFFKRENPFALQEITAVMLETSRKGYWQATEAQLRGLASLHVALVQEFAPGCSGFVCDNGKLRDVISKYVDQPTAAAYQQRLTQVREGAASTQKGVVLEKEQAPVPPPSSFPVPPSAFIGLSGLGMLAAALAWFVWAKRRRPV